MKKTYWFLFCLGICSCIVGIAFHDLFIILDILLIIIGITLFLFTFIKYCFSNAKRCPNCNAPIYGGHIRTIARQKNGITTCEKCGCLLHVNRLYQK